MNLFRNLVLNAVCLFFATAVSAQTAEVMHFWNFEGNFNDQIGMAHGTVTGSTTVTLDAGFDAGMSMRTQAAVFGDDDLVRIDDTQTFTPGNDAFSFSYWFNIANDGTTDPRGIFDFSGDGGDGPQSLYIGTSDSLAFRIDGLAGSGGGAALFPMNLEDSQWHFVVANYDPVTGSEVYVDGPDLDAASGAVGFVMFDADQYLGTFNFNNPGDLKGLNGRLDDLAIYSGKLTNTEIMGLFDGTLSPFDFATNVLLGDVNCDGIVGLLDVQPFVALLTSGGFSPKADINGDGVVSLLDVAGFIDILTGG